MKTIQIEIEDSYLDNFLSIIDSLINDGLDELDEYIDSIK